MPSVEPPPEGTLLAGRYRLDRVLGDGGMGRVWQAYDETLGRRVAVKEVLYPRDLSSRDQRALSERTMREARLTAQLSHPNIVTTYDAVVDDGMPFIVMELVPSVSLADRVAADGPLEPEEVARLGLTLLDTLAMAHSRGVVHRDVKPSNVLLADDGRVLLSDFGIATHESDPTLTTSGILIGSPAFMSPERLRGERRGYAADVWALGATLYTALEGHPPFHADTSMATITAILSDEVAPPRVSGPLADAVMGMLVKDHERRLTLQQAKPLLAAAADGRASLADTAADTEPQETPPPTREEPVAAAGPAWETPDQEHRHEDFAGGESPVWETPPPPPRRAPDEPRRRGVVMTLVLAILVAIAVVGLGAAVVTSLDDGETPTAEPPAQSTQDETERQGAGATRGNQPAPDASGEEEQQSPTPAPEANVPARAAPEGFEMRQDPLGFQVAVPDGWQRRLDGPTRVDYVSPDGSSFVRIDQRADALPDAEEAWLDAEPAVADSLGGYQRIRIDSVPHPEWDVADWEFTWETSSGTTLHVLNRGIATDTRGFALYVSAPDESWATEGRPVFDVVSNTFAPTR
jgi:serine/threonine protein kinase